MIIMRFLDINKKNNNKLPFIFVDDFDEVYFGSPIFMNFLELSNARTLTEELKALYGKC